MPSAGQDDKMSQNIPQCAAPAQEYAMHYSDKGFWNKLRKYALKAGHAVVYRALVLYYVLMDTQTPYWARSVVIGALGYFILPIDLIPDFIPVGGFMDDLGALVTALYTVGSNVNDTHRKQAKAKMMEWFPIELIAKERI